MNDKLDKRELTESSPEKVALNKFITLQRGFDLPKADRTDGKVPVVASTGVGGYHNVAKATAPGVVIGRSGSIGGGQYIQDVFWPLNTTLWVKDFKGHNPRYIYYLLKSIDFQRFNVGSGVPTLNRNHLSSLMVVDLGIDAEKRIAHILGSLDDKIELNRKMNETLEQMAQTLFKSWFVDFDPVIGNALASGNEIPEELSDRAQRRQELGAKRKELPEEIRSLFPNEFELTDELGWIPKGWRAGVTEELFELHRGFDLPKTKRKDGPYPVYAAGGLHGQHCEYKIEPPGIITGRSGVIGNVYLSLEKYWPLNTTLYVRQFRACGPFYAYFFLKSCDLKMLNSGSAVPSLNRNLVHNSIAFIPEKALLDRFETISKGKFQMIEHTKKENLILSETRDKLLPRLLSGMIHLPELEHLYGER